MGRGGKRERAGRKKGVGNFLTEGLREKIDAEMIIGFLQNLVEGKIEGASVSERKDAGIALLRKVLPDTRPSLSDKSENNQPCGVVVYLPQEEQI